MPRNVPPPDDLTSTEFARVAGYLMEAGTEVYVKWTCPSCGERVMADDACPKVDRGPGLKFGVGMQPKYMHTTKANGDPCMISVDTLLWRFGMLTVDHRGDAVVVVDYD